MLLVLLWGRAGNEEVIDVCVAEVESLEHLVDEALERLSGVTQPKRHPQKLEKTEGCCDGCLGDICRLDWYLMVRTYQVDLGEDTAAMERCREVLYVRDRISVWDRCIVECPVVSTRTPVAWGLFRHHVQGR